MEAIKGLRYRPLEHDDWGIIRYPNRSEIFAVVRRPLSSEEAAAHRTNGTDPFEDLARTLMNTAESIDAERTVIANKAREYAAHYDHGSDGRNTFILLAEWIENRMGDPN